MERKLKNLFKPGTGVPPQTGKREITMAMVREIEPEVLAECNEMYLDRRNELTEMNLLPVAE